MLIKFFIPAMVVVDRVAYKWYLQKDYDEAMHSIEEVENLIEISKQQTQAQTGEPTEDVGWIDKLKRVWDTAKQVADSGLSALQEQLSKFAGDFIDLMTVFLIQTAVIPFLCLFIFWQIFRKLIS